MFYTAAQDSNPGPLCRDSDFLATVPLLTNIKPLWNLQNVRSTIRRMLQSNNVAKRVFRIKYNYGYDV